MSNKEARRLSRITAVKTLFVYYARKESIAWEECFDHILYEDEERESDKFSHDLVAKVLQEFPKIKLIIRGFAPEFPFEKIAPMNRVLLMLGITEMKFFDTPPIVVINEYIEIAKLFGEQRSASFINGVLDAFRKNIGKERQQDE